MSNSRNKPCECGSGKKYKKCCLKKEIDTANEEAEKKIESDMEQMDRIGDRSWTLSNKKKANFAAILGLAMNLEADRRNRMFR